MSSRDNEQVFFPNEDTGLHHDDDDDDTADIEEEIKKANSAARIRSRRASGKAASIAGATTKPSLEAGGAKKKPVALPVEATTTAVSPTSERTTCFDDDKEKYEAAAKDKEAYDEGSSKFRDGLLATKAVGSVEEEDRQLSYVVVDEKKPAAADARGTSGVSSDSRKKSRSGRETDGRAQRSSSYIENTKSSSIVVEVLSDTSPLARITVKEDVEEPNLPTDPKEAMLGAVTPREKNYQEKEDDMGAPRTIEEEVGTPSHATDRVRPGAYAVAGLGIPSQNDEVPEDNTSNAHEESGRSLLSEEDVPVISAFAVGASASSGNQMVEEETPLDRAERIRRSILENAPVIEGVVRKTDRGGVSRWKGYIRRHPLRAFIALFASVLVIVGATLAGVYVGGAQDDGEPRNRPSSASPSQDPMIVRFESIRSILLSEGVSSLEVLEDSSSPQHRALNWIVYEDDRQVSWQEDFEHITQRYVLATFYFATGGGDGSWINTYNFLTSEHECSWWSPAKPNTFNQTTEGVFCSQGTTDGMVDSLFTLHNNMTGTLPDELQFLPNLIILGVLGNPLLSGNIPSSLSKLTSLEILYLFGNQLVGPIPEDFGRLTNLIHLFLYSNNLTGTIPRSLANLTSSLVDLELADNQLRGAIPEEFGRLTQIEKLILPSNQLTGTIPPSFGNLSSIDTLSLSLNQLYGPVPEVFGMLTRLRRLFLFSNQLTGTIAASFGNLTSLAQLELANNPFSGPIPEELGELTQLQLLNLHSNNLTDTIPLSLGNLISLVDLQLDDNQLFGPLPEEIGKLTSLTSLQLYSNQLTGMIPLSFGNLTSLVNLELNNNQLSGPIPKEFENLSQLEKLYLYSNQLNGTIPTILGNLSSLIYISLRSNQLMGPIPEELGRLTKLEELYLWNNALTGTIPQTLGKLKSMVELVLSWNQLNGSIPEELGHLMVLEDLHLNFNQLTGTIPPSFGNLTSLARLSLDQNSLNGSVPVGICNLRNTVLGSIWVDCMEVECACCTVCCNDTDNGGSLCCSVSDPSNCGL